jgi:hypothetical protein
MSDVRYKVEYYREEDDEPQFVGIYEHYEDALIDYKFYSYTGDVLIFVESNGDWVEVIVSISDQEDNSEEEECDDEDGAFMEDDEDEQ